MKTEISRNSHQSEKRYSGVYQQQGRMLTDADWNELVEILKARLNEALKDVVGSQQGSIGGTPRQRALRIVDDGGIKIQPGHIYIDGMAATLPGNPDAPLDFDGQPDFPEPPTPPTPNGNYVLYADVWERTVTHLMDERLRDKGLHGADTCSRKQMLAQIKWCPDDIDPEGAVNNPAKGDAELTLTLLQKTTDPDDCDPCAAELDIDTRVGNYLFRVEVHDVQGDADGPTEITLKWSSENGAEQFLALPTQEEMPAGFISDKWVYEFFDQTSERHLGVHLNNTVWQPARVELKEFSETSGVYAVPTIPGSSETQIFVRRWDGYCKLDLTSGLGSLSDGIDRGVELDTDKTVDSLGYVSIGPKLEMVLNSLKLELELTAKSIVAGDFWLADVREAEHSEGSVLLDTKPPQGIEHYYLTLGSVSGGALQANPEIDRKYAFPPLTQMTRLFMAGGDGQEIVPGEPLPQPLRVGVANGEWPVVGATVRFEIEDGDGSLSVADDVCLTNADGIAECVWSPDVVIGATCRVKASLVDPDHPTDPALDLVPPVYFYANLISADQVAYTPGCQPDDTEELTVHHLLLGPDDTRLGDDDYYTVKEVLDALLCELKADHIPYDAPACDADTVRALLGDDFDADGLLTVKDVLDTLLCQLKAEHVPYDPEDQASRWDDINDDGEERRPTTVQQAIDDLCDLKADDLPLDKNEDLCDELNVDTITSVQDALNYLCDHTGGVSCAITVSEEGDQNPTLAEVFEKFAESETLREICICLLPGRHEIEIDPAVLDKKSIRITGCGAQASKIFIIETLELGANEIQLRDLSIIGGKEEDNATESGTLLLTGKANAHFIIENCVFNRVVSGAPAQWPPLVLVAGSVKLDWHSNSMMATRWDEKVTDAVIPDKSRLTDDSEAWNVAVKLEELWTLNPYAEDYEKKVKDAAKAIVNLDQPARQSLSKAMHPDIIDNVPNVEVDISRTNRILSDRWRLSEWIPTHIGTGVPVSPHEAVKAFWKAIEEDVDEVNQVIGIIKALAAFASSFDYALALASSEVGGSITRNEISGNVALHFNKKGLVPLSWQSTLANGSLIKNKGDWADEHLKPSSSWKTVGQLSLQGNKLNAVHSMVTHKTLEALKEVINGKLGALEEPPDAYESMSLSDNYFAEDRNSLMSKFMTLNGNQFLYPEDYPGDTSGITLAYTLGYRGIFLGNMSVGLSNHGVIVIEKMMSDDNHFDEANFFQII